jgi:carboxypeptidase C (cathepsin A)
MGGKEYTYAAVAGEVLIETGPQDAKAKGRVFYVSYEMQEKKAAERPLTFAFNGGPGAASVWLHLGALGPKRIVLADDGRPLPPPVRWEDNPYTWLAFTDLVFLDPIGTGFSRSESDDKKTGQAFYGVEQDIEAVAECIRLYLNEHARWMSPKFLVGESYGTTRASGLTQRLHERYGIDMNAVVLISPVLDFQTILFHPSSDLPYLLFLPTYSAAAWHHGILPQPLQQKPLAEVLEEAETFCLNDYPALLAKGEALNEREAKRLLTQLSSFTALSEEIIGERHFRIDWMVFTKNLLKKRGLVVGRMDTTITGGSTDPAEPYPQYDPALNRLYGSFSTAINGYLREHLRFETTLFYEFLNPEVTKRWDWSSGLSHGQGFVDLSHTLKEVLTIRRDMRVFIACGLYDLATPYLASQYTLDHMWLGDAGAHVTMKRYKAGHMIYLKREALQELFCDIRAFYHETNKAQ